MSDIYDLRAAVRTVLDERTMTTNPLPDLSKWHEVPADADIPRSVRYAVMKDGATSKVVVLNRAEIARIKTSAQGADSSYSPWQTNPAAMWLKSAVRQLAKWVPTSAEYRKEQLRAVQEVHAELSTHHASPGFQQEAAGGAGYVDPLTGEVYADEVHDAELVGDES